MNNLQVFKEITLDFYDQKIVKVEAKQLDKNARYISISCTNNGKDFLLDSSIHHAYVRMKKPDGHYVFNVCTIDSTGKVLVEMTEQMVNVVGTCFADIMVTDQPINIPATVDTTTTIAVPKNIKIISTMRFMVNVVEIPMDYNAIESSHELSALNQLFEKAFADYTNVITEARKSEQAAKTSEANAKASETKALQSEKNADGSAKESQVVLDRLLACDYTRLNNDVTNLKSDILTKATTTYVNEQIANIHQFSREIVTSLPQSGIKTNVIYMIKANKPNDHNIYDEYINVDGTPGGYELIGSTAPDLTGYAKETFVNNAFTSHNSDSSCHNDIRNDLAGKSNKSDIVNNLYSSRLDLPLSANMGRELKSSIDAINVPTKVSQLNNDSGFMQGVTVIDKISAHNSQPYAHEDIRKLITNIGKMVSVGTHNAKWTVTSNYADMGNALSVVDGEYFKTISGSSKVVIKKAGVYLLNFKGIYSNNNTPQDRIWVQIKQNGQQIGEDIGYIWYNGTMSCCKVVIANANDYIETALSSTSGTLESAGKDILSITCINTLN